MFIKKIAWFGAIFLVLGSMSLVAFAQSNTIPTTNTSPQLVCEYAAPSEGCSLVPGPNYNAVTQCGLVLKCDGSGDQPINISTICDYAAPPENCSYVKGPNYNSSNQCGMVLKCDGSAFPTIEIISPSPKPVPLPISSSGSVLSGTARGGSVITSSGVCPSGYLTSSDEKSCLKFDSFSPLTVDVSSSFGTTSESISVDISGEEKTTGTLIPSVTSSGQAEPVPSDGKCPSGYIVSNDVKTCTKLFIPTIFVSPTSASESFTFSSGSFGNIDVENSTTMQKTSISPIGGFKVIVDTESPVTVQKGIDNIISISRNDISASVTTSGNVEVKEGRVIISGQEMKVMPDDAVSTAGESLKATVQSINLSEGSESNVAYKITATKDSKIIGIFPVQMSITANVNVQTAAMENIQRPWWSFLAW